MRGDTGVQTNCHATPWRLFVAWDVSLNNALNPVRKLGKNLVVLRCVDVEYKVTTTWKRGRVTTKVNVFEEKILP